MKVSSNCYSKVIYRKVHINVKKYTAVPWPDEWFLAVVLASLDSVGHCSCFLVVF